ncbi:MAG: hypothetical protein R3F55_11225 [Alphaproteobacteria bacterium]
MIKFAPEMLPYAGEDAEVAFVLLRMRRWNRPASVPAVVIGAQTGLGVTVPLH